MSKHTPGPWSLGHCHENKCGHLKFYEFAVHAGDYKNRGNWIATVGMGGPGGTQSDRESVAANARLVSASPDLLEALKMAHRYLFTGEGPEEIDAAELATEIERALAKAEGRA